MAKNFDVVRTNIINNFLNRNYLWTCVTHKKAVFDDMVDRSPFPFEYNYDNYVLMVNLGNNINIAVNFTWEHRNNNLYRLIKIS